MDCAIEKDGTQLQNNNFDTFRLSLLLNNNNMAWRFVGKYEHVSSFVSWKIPLYEKYKH